MEQKADREIDRHPRQIEERNRAASGQKAAYRIEVANRLSAVTFCSGLERQPDDRVVDAGTHGFVETMADPHQDAASNHVDEPLRAVQTGHQDQQTDQCRQTAARQDTIVDFEHEQRTGQHQNVAHAGKQRNGDKSAPAGTERVGKFGTRGLRPERTGGLAHEACVPSGGRNPACACERPAMAIPRRSGRSPIKSGTL